MRLIKSKKGAPSFIDLQANLYALCIDSLFKGKYKLLHPNMPSTVLELKINEATNGFKNYNKYRIHDYFGTSHPYPADAIIFEDTTFVNRELKPPTNFEVFSWEFKGDTLIMTKMFTKNDYNYQKGTKAYQFLKLKK